MQEEKAGALAPAYCRPSPGVNTLWSQGPKHKQKQMCKFREKKQQTQKQNEKKEHLKDKWPQWKDNFHLRSEAGLNPKLKVWFPQPQWLHFPFLSPFLPSPPHRLSSPRAPSPPSAWWRRPWHTEVSPARGQTHRPAGRHRYPPPLLLLLPLHSFRRKCSWFFLFTHFFLIFVKHRYPPPLPLPSLLLLLLFHSFRKKILRSTYFY